MTNAEKFKEIFGIEIDCGTCNPYPCNENDCEFWEKCENEPVRPCDSWWDWEFKEPAPDIDKCIEKLKHEKQCFIDGLWENTGEIEAYDMAIDTMNKFKVLFQIMKEWAVSEHPELTKVEYFDKIVELMNEKGK